MISREVKIVMQSIISVNNDINSWYRASKLPKVIKKIIAKYKRAKLKKIISKFTNKIYTINDIYWVLNYCNKNFDGNFSYIASVKSPNEDIDPNLLARLQYGDSESGNYYYYTLDVNYRTKKMDISIVIETDNGKKSFSIYGKNNLDTDDYKEDFIKYLINALNSMFSEIIEDILNDIITRSERIYEL